MTNKERIKAYFLEQEHVAKQIVDASFVADILQIKRNAASALLNELAVEGFLHKTKSRPVLFQLAIGDERAKEETEDLGREDVEDPFCEVIGYNKSLKKQIDICKVSATYPGRGLPILLLGPSGSGKSMLAKHIYLYSKYKGTIRENAPYIVLNCADYANNVDILSSVLFGYKKGAFTGANKDTMGLLQKANNGYLFLDEVHRLPPEGQEKLFRYIDSGMISGFGAGNNEISVNVRLIFATTEDADTIFLDTFKRRIPVEISLPSYEKRSVEERLAIICNLFYQEGTMMKANLSISNNVVDYLMVYDGKGNIGGLKNLIKLSCANAYNKGIRNEQGEILVTLNNLSEHPHSDRNILKRIYQKEWLTIDISKPSMTLTVGNERLINEVIPIKKIEEILLKRREHSLTDDTLRKEIYKLINEITNELLSGEESLDVRNLYGETVENVLRYLHVNYGLKYNGIQVSALAKLLEQMENSYGEEQEKDKIKRLHKIIKSDFYKHYKLADIFYSMVKSNLDYSAVPELTRIILTLYFYYIMDITYGTCNAIIVTHGASTASSIAALVNRVFSKYIFEPFDMPYEMPESEMLEVIRTYLTGIDTSMGILVFVDMGSLMDMGKELHRVVHGELGIMNNVTTQLILDAGDRIIQKQPVEQILKEISNTNKTSFQYFENTQKRNAIVVCCATGIGTASKIRDMLKVCSGSMDVEIIPCEYHELKTNKRESDIFKKYNVLFVVTTMGLEMEGVHVLLLNELITDTGEEIVKKTLRTCCRSQEINAFYNNLIKDFSLKNIISQLTILNPDKILEDVENAVAFLENLINHKLSVDIKKMLYIHACLMIERAMTDKSYVSDDFDVEFAKCHGEFVEMLKKAFSVIEKKYNVSINMKEIRMIYNIIELQYEEKVPF